MVRWVKVRVWQWAMNDLAASFCVWPWLRVAMWRALGLRMGHRPSINGGHSLSDPLLVLGDDVFINVGLTVNGLAEVEIGDRVQVGPGVMFLTTGHEVGPSEDRAGPNTGGPIVVGAGSWIGGGVVVLGGVTIGPGCVVGAGSVVTHDLEPDCLYLGTPARLARRFTDAKPLDAADSVLRDSAASPGRRRGFPRRAANSTAALRFHQWQRGPLPEAGRR